MNADEAVAAVAFITSIGIVIDAVEVLKPNNVLDRFFDWKITRRRYAWLGKEHSILGFLTQTRPLQALVVAQTVAAVASPFFLLTNAPYAAPATLFVLGVLFLLRLRLPYSINGADQMQGIIWAALSGYALTGDELGQFVALGFIAAQAVLSYVTAGIKKLADPFWRDGTAVGLVLQTETFGMPQLAAKLSTNTFSAAASWSTIVFEIFGPVIILFGPTPTLVFIGMATILHASIAIMMGLNRFFFAFGATYPALYWTSVQLHDWVQGWV